MSEATETPGQPIGAPPAGAPPLRPTSTAMAPMRTMQNANVPAEGWARDAPPHRPAEPGKPVRAGWALAFRILASVFAAGVVIQVFLAGAGVFHDPRYFTWHTNFVHAIEMLPLLMLGTALLARLRRKAWIVSLVLFGLVSMQYTFVHLDLGAAKGLHAVNALAIFALALSLVHHAPAAPDPRGAARSV